MIKPELSLSVILTLVLFFGIGACVAFQSAINEIVINKKKGEVKVTESLKEGDIIFQTSTSKQCEAVQLATKSKYSHVGIVFRRAENWMVLEAVQPVKYTNFKEWVDRGKNDHYVVKRLIKRDSILPDSLIAQMKKKGDQFINKNYDLYFGWSDERIYCSELVWKIYKEAAGLKVGKLQKLKDFDLSQGIVKQLVKERYGDNIPLEETVISPASIYASTNLKTILIK